MGSLAVHEEGRVVRVKDAKVVLEELEMLKKFCEDNISEAINVSVCRVFEGCRVAVNDAIKIIEEQGERIAIMTESKPELVRCKDCKHKEESVSPSWEAWCNRLHCGCDLDWFCADGERKE